MHTVVNHPLVQHKLSLIRNKDTNRKLFRECIQEITKFLAYEALREIPVEPIDVETPIATAHCNQVTSELVVVPILRAGVGMLDALTDLVPNIRIGFLGIYRDHETALPVEYFSKIPDAQDNSIAIIIDPMLATGGTSCSAIESLQNKGFKKVILICILTCPEGLAVVEAEHPEVPIYTAAIDSHLNEKSYIVPGLGDAGDRFFGTL